MPSWSARTTTAQSAPAGTGPDHTSWPLAATRSCPASTATDRARSRPRSESGSAVSSTTRGSPSTVSPAASARADAQGAVTSRSIGR